ncbi:MAG: glutamine-hydrolyzing GMP synthase [Acholeplasmatales bacterium]|nr:MAG: glutamine-hydrolyzing GMP synthase [Acholeplasmatales bacterium]
MPKTRIVILDYGSQYTRLIAKRIRALGVFTDILPHDTFAITLANEGDLAGVVLSGGPQSVTADNAYPLDPAILELGVPILGICYGMQRLALDMGGAVEQSVRREYGQATLFRLLEDPLFTGWSQEEGVWMSHGDHIESIPQDFEQLAQNSAGICVAMRHISLPVYGIQFHPEVRHTARGETLLQNFVQTICQCEPLWSMENFIEDTLEEIRATVGDEQVLLGLSGGVDSSVAAVLIDRAIGAQLTCVFVDHGFLREGEADAVMQTFGETYQLNIVKVDAHERFMTALAEVDDPEQKRKIIGRLFVDVFTEAAQSLGEFAYLAQGTLYTDIIESGTGAAKTIKSHHNVGGLPETLGFKLLEPLKTLFKDEVREVGTLLGLPEAMVHRQPFPGPGLAIRVLGPVDAKRVAMVRQSDAILREEIKRHNLERDIWQYFTVLTPIKTVGVMGDGRTYENVLAIRAVTSVDGMTADWAKIPYPVLEQLARRLVNEVLGINRVVYDITSKPPATIEWE